MRLIHKQATPQAIEFFIKYLACIWLFMIVIDPLPELSLMPVSAFRPTGFYMRPLPESIIHLFLSKPALVVLKYGIIISLVGVIWNKYRLLCLCVLSVLLTQYQAIVRGFGHLNHAELPVLYAVYIFTFCGVADWFSRKKGEPQDRLVVGLPLILIGAVMCFIYNFTAVHRLVLSGFSLFNAEDMMKWIIETTNKPRLFAWNLDSFVYSQTWLHPLLKWGFIAVTFFELTAPLALLSRSYRICFIPTMILFHVLSWLFLSIFFWEEVLLYLVFFEWYRSKNQVLDP